METEEIWKAEEISNSKRKAGGIIISEFKAFGEQSQSSQPVHKNKLLHTKETINKMQRQLTELEKVFANYVAIMINIQDL